MRRRGWVVVSIAAAIAFFYVWQRTDVIRMGYGLEKLKVEKKKLEQVHNQLLVEVSTLASLERVERIATTSLGMKHPVTGQIVLVSLPADGGKYPDGRTAALSAGNAESSKAFQVAQASPVAVSKVMEERSSTLIQRLKDAL
jgi:cell division protein FtsL